MNYGQKYSEERRLTILRKLVQCGDMSLLEMGFSATPQAVRNLAARGLVKVTVALTPRGRDAYEAMCLKALKKAAKDRKAKHEAAKVGEAA